MESFIANNVLFSLHNIIYTNTWFFWCWLKRFNVYIVIFFISSMLLWIFYFILFFIHFHISFRLFKLLSLVARFWIFQTWPYTVIMFYGKCWIQAQFCDCTVFWPLYTYDRLKIVFIIVLVFVSLYLLHIFVQIFVGSTHGSDILICSLFLGCIKIRFILISVANWCHLFTACVQESFKCGINFNVTST